MLDKIREAWEQLRASLSSIWKEDRLDKKTPGNDTKWPFDKRIVGADGSGMFPGEVLYRDDSDGTLKRRWVHGDRAQTVIFTTAADGSVVAGKILDPPGDGKEIVITESTLNGSKGYVTIENHTAPNGILCYVGGGGLSVGPFAQGVKNDQLDYVAAAGDLEATQKYCLSLKYYVRGPQ